MTAPKRRRLQATGQDLLRIVQDRCECVADCWVWQNYIGGSGPEMQWDGKPRYVRRLVYAQNHGGMVPEGKVVTPRCGNKRCVSPACLMAVPLRVAQKMAAKRGAYSNPARLLRANETKRARSHITQEKVDRIRSFEGTAKEAAEREGVSWSHAKAIRRGDARADVVGNPFAGLLAAQRACL